MLPAIEARQITTASNDSLWRLLMTFWFEPTHAPSTSSSVHMPAVISLSQTAISRLRPRSK